MRREEREAGVFFIVAVLPTRGALSPLTRVGAPRPLKRAPTVAWNETHEPRPASKRTNERRNDVCKARLETISKEDDDWARGAPSPSERGPGRLATPLCFGSPRRPQRLRRSRPPRNSSTDPPHISNTWS